MIFEARYQSFKILLMTLSLVGSTFVANCRAERTPFSPDRHGFFQELLGAEAERHLETIKLERERQEQLWSDFKLFASEQATVAQQKWANSDLKKWWEYRSDRDVSPAAEQHPAYVAEAGRISPTAMVVNYAANMTAQQWWQASNLAVEVLDRGHQVARATIKFETDFQASFSQLIELSSVTIAQFANSPWINGVIQAMSVIENSDSISADSRNEESSNTDSPMISKSTDAYPTADPYWQYYADCDFWGAQFDAAQE